MPEVLYLAKPTCLAPAPALIHISSEASAMTLCCLDLSHLCQWKEFQWLVKMRAVCTGRKTKAHSMAITQSQGKVSTAAKTLQACIQLQPQKAVRDAAQHENKTFPNVSLNLLSNREHHVSIAPKSSSLKRASY